MEEKSKKVLLNSFRWLAVLPAAVLGSWLVYIICVFGNKITYSIFQTHATIWNYGVLFFAHLIMGGAFMMIGVSVAPLYKCIVAIILFCLVCISSGMTIFANIINGFEWSNLVCTICTIGGASYCLYLYSKENI